VICLKNSGLDAFVDPLHVQNNFAFLTNILTIEALTAFTMGVNCDRGKSLIQCWQRKRRDKLTEDVWDAAVAG